MYEDYTRQSLPSKEYRELLGSALCVFNSNNAFIIENILREDGGANYNWYDLMDRTSGNLSKPISDTITNKAGSKIATLYYRDDYMDALAEEYPQYDWKGNKGYPTKKHILPAQRMPLS